MVWRVLTHSVCGSTVPFVGQANRVRMCVSPPALPKPTRTDPDPRRLCGILPYVCFFVAPVLHTPEDCKVFAQVLESAAEGKAPDQSVDVTALLAAYNERRFEDAAAAVALSEGAMGGARTRRLKFQATMMVTMALHKTLGRLAPQVRGNEALLRPGDGRSIECVFARREYRLDKRKMGGEPEEVSWQFFRLLCTCVRSLCRS